MRLIQSFVNSDPHCSLRACTRGLADLKEMCPSAVGRGALMLFTSQGEGISVHLTRVGMEVEPHG